MSTNLAKTLGTKRGHLSRAFNSLSECLKEKKIDSGKIKKYLNSVTEKYEDLKPMSNKLVDLYREEENDKGFGASI